jgi:phage terminase large subunit-like protein
MKPLTRSEALQLIALLEERERRQNSRRIRSYFASEGEHRRELYPKHLEFFTAGADYKLRLFMAANRVGKTLAAAYELTCHLTGNYPDWWPGRRNTGPSSWWVCGKDSRTIMAILQNTLLGPVGEFGTGMIPKDSLDFDTLKDAKKADTGVTVFRVKHSSGGYSSVEFKAYDAGRTSFEGTERSIWLDEEPPLSVFTECLLRTATGNNMLMMTFTPLKGISDTILNFLEGSQFHEGPVGEGKYVVMAGWSDVPHLSEADKKILLASIPPFQRDARTKGIPQLGAGAIYPIPESEVAVDRFDIPKSWRKLYGLDVGWNKTAAIWLAQDPNTNIWYAYGEYYKGESEPSSHAATIRARGDWIPGVIDTAARGRSQIDGDNLMQMYKDLGLKLNDADKAVETGLFTVWELLSTGQLKVFSDLKNFWNEYRLYRRDEKGKVIKTNDHIMDALRYAMMGRDVAKPEYIVTKKARVYTPSAGNMV